MKDNYDDIINMPYRKSEKYPHMSIYDRAAQFAPFSALTGYSDTIDEEERLTSVRTSLDEYEIELINRELQYAVERIEEKPLATVTYFVPDLRKSGGAYHTVSGRIERIDDNERKVKLVSGMIIPIGEIFALEIERE